MEIMVLHDIHDRPFRKSVEDGMFFAKRWMIKMLNYEEIEDNKKQCDG